VELLFEKQAARRLLDLPMKARLSLIKRLERIAERPFARHASVKPLTGHPDTFRLRQGEWRAIYVVDRKADQMRVTRIAPRGEVYR
jgi:mRNA-degrading endonuclease RelE of RelBE toxin-antitoxin system